METGYVYKITSPLTDKIYIGSTTTPLDKRLSEHKSKYKGYLTGKGNNVSSFQIIKLGECKIELIENVVFDDKKQLRNKERYYIENTANIINKNINGIPNEQIS